MLADAIYDGELSGTAFLILFAALLVIVCGLGWCFYRALKAAGESAPDQLPDNGGRGPAE
ncbi:MAG: hypothetical protein ACYS5V_07435 [Planctomycetota bacterium]|jgi:hypothetical protein